MVASFILFVKILVFCHQVLADSAQEHIFAPEHFFNNKRVLTVTIILIEPYAMLKKINSSAKVKHSNDMYEGYCVDLIARLSNLIGFRYRLVPVWDQNFGHRQVDGTWNGLIGELIRRESDLAVAPLFITPQRSQVVDFTHPFLEVQATALLKRPAPGDPPIRDLIDLSRDVRYRYGTLNRGLIRRAFRTTNSTLEQIIWENMNLFGDDVFTDTNEQGVAKVRGEHYAFILPDVIGEYLARRPPCDLLTLGHFLFRRGYGIALPKGSHRLPTINRMLSVMRHDGTLAALYRKWWVDQSRCSGAKVSKITSDVTINSSIRGCGQSPVLYFLLSVIASNCLVFR